MKATSIFGGVQVFQIAVTMVRSKLVAVLLGAQGMGISGLLLSATTMVTSLTNFGVTVSAVKNVAEASSSGDSEKVSRIVSIVKKLVWVTGILGALVMIIFSKWLSIWTFGNDDFTLAFVWLSITMILGNITSGEFVILQGLRQLNYLARANIIGAFAGLVISVPLYYFFRIDGIVPAMIATAILSLVIAIYFGRKVRPGRVTVSREETLQQSKVMIKMGVMLSLTGLISALTGYLTRIYISNEGSIADVGLFNAGFAIVNTYIGMIFTAMATDYYPRLTAVINDAESGNKLINQQAEIALLILGPLLVMFLVFIKLVITTLYSAEFLASADMMQWIVLAIFFKALTWSMGFVLLATNRTTTFFWNEFVTSVYTFALNIVGYKLFGLEGLGISFLIAYAITIFQNHIVIRRRFALRLEWDLIKILFIHFALAVVAIVLADRVESPWRYFAALPIISLSVWYSYTQLEKKLSIMSVIQNFIKRKQ